MAVENSKIVYGGSLMIFIASGATKIPLAFSQSADLSLAMDTREVSSKDSGLNKSFKSGKFSWDASSAGVYSTGLSGGTYGINTLYTLYKTGVEVGFAFAVASGTTPNHVVNTSEINFTGKVLITSLSFSAPDNDNATWSISMQGTDDLVMA